MRRNPSCKHFYQKTQFFIIKHIFLLWHFSFHSFEPRHLRILGFYSFEMHFKCNCSNSSSKYFLIVFFEIIHVDIYFLMAQLSLPSWDQYPKVNSFFISCLYKIEKKLIKLLKNFLVVLQHQINIFCTI